MTRQEYQHRRQALLSKMAVESALIIFSAQECLRNGDSHYPFRQDSYFWYLTGFNEPDSVLILLKRENEQAQTVLFNREKDKTAEIWQGYRLGQEAAPHQLGIDHAFPFHELAEHLPRLLNGLTVLYHAEGISSAADTLIVRTLEALRQGVRKNWSAPTTLTDWRPFLNEMRLIKSTTEIQLIRQAAEISAAAHLRAMKNCRAGLYEYQLEADILHEFAYNGARYPAYNTIVGGGENGCILHYTDNNAVLRDGDLVLIDAGCEYQGYAGDITRTFPINGVFTPPQRQIYEIVLAAQHQALTHLKPGSSIKQAMSAAVRVIVTGLVKLGILQGEIEQLIEEKAYRAYFMHGLGHWLGLDVHDVGHYTTPERDRTLEVGMVLTVEPGLYIASDAPVASCYHGIGVRIEDNIVITDTGHEVLTSKAIKDPDAIEAFMATVS